MFLWVQATPLPFFIPFAPSLPPLPSPLFVTLLCHEADFSSSFRGSVRALLAPKVGSGAKPRPKTHFCTDPNADIRRTGKEAISLIVPESALFQCVIKLQHTGPLWNKQRCKDWRLFWTRVQKFHFRLGLGLILSFNRSVCIFPGGHP